MVASYLSSRYGGMNWHFRYDVSHWWLSQKQTKIHKQTYKQTNKYTSFHPPTHSPNQPTNKRTVSISKQTNKQTKKSHKKTSGEINIAYNTQADACHVSKRKHTTEQKSKQRNSTLQDQLTDGRVRYRSAMQKNRRCDGDCDFNSVRLYS